MSGIAMSAARRAEIEGRPAPPSLRQPIVLTLPWRVLVSDNAKYGVLKGHALLQSRYRTAKQAAALLALAQMRQARHAPFPRECGLAMTVTLYPPDRRRRDLTNHAKLIGDSLESVCYADDAQLDDVHYIRGPLDRVNPRAEITLEPLTVTPHR